MLEPTQSPKPSTAPRSRRALLGGALTAGAVAATFFVLRDDVRRATDGSSALAEGAAIESELVRINHLLRRAGFGVSPAEYDRYQTIGLQATIDELLGYASIDDSYAEGLAAVVDPRTGDRGSPALWWLTRMASTKRPLQEKMTLFWHGLLTSQLSVVRDAAAMVNQNEFFRSNAMADLPSILRGITYDPAMMVYLNTAGSQKSAPNENYARELMELYALGEGNYTEQDVREAARALTGWTIPRSRADVGVALQSPVFRPQQFDDGRKSFLGHEGNLHSDDVVQIIAEQPAAARHIVSKLYAFFIHPDPTEADIDPFVTVFESNQRRVGPVVEAMLRSDIFYSPRAYRSLVKSPVEYVVGAIKALDLQAELPALTNANQGVRGGGGALGAMGQIPFEPPNVAGWQGGKHWLNSSTMFARLNFLNTLTGGGTLEQRFDLDDRPAVARRQERLQQSLILPGVETPTAVFARYLPLLLDDNLPEEALTLLGEYGGSPEATLTPDVQRGLVYLLLASPQYHLA